MCLNRYNVFNKYTGHVLLVDCGKCVECKVKKANINCSKIVADFELGYNYYFVTLTYNNRYVPYVLHQSIKCGLVPVYRNNNKIKDIIISEKLVDLDKLVMLRNHYIFGAVGVLVWDDLTKFFKRLRKNLKLKDNGFTFSYFAVSEYGETFYRPHFHILFKTKVSLEVFKDSVTSCWSFCDWNSVPRGFESAISPQKYLSLYVSSTIHLPSFLRLNDTCPKKSHSLHFGFGKDEFSLAAVFHSAEKHNLTYYRPSSSPTSSSPGSFVPYPTYVLHRYFPKYKGFSRLSFDDFFFLAKSLNIHDKGNTNVQYYPPIGKEIISQCLVYTAGLNNRLFKILSLLRYTNDDVKSTLHAINRAYQYAKELNVDFEYYLRVWYNVYVIIFSQSIRESLTSTTDFANYYFNINEFINMKIRAPTLHYLLENLSLDEFSPISEFDKKCHNSALRKSFKYNKNKKFKTHLL